MAASSQLPEGLLTGENAAYVDMLFARWQEDPTDVPSEWSAVFAGLSPSGATPGVGRVPEFPRRSIFAGSSSGPAATLDAATVMAAARRQTAVAQLINAFRVRGHKQARIDPLGRQTIEPHPM